jgi:hypothetical protein
MSLGIDAQTHAATSKATPVDADEVPIVDSASSFSLKKLTWGNLKATLKAYFDGIYANLSSPALTGTPTAPTAAAGTNTTQLATTAFAKTQSESVAIGVNQTWQDVTASRALGTTYTNSTGKPILITITLYSTTSNANPVLNLYVNGVIRQIGGCYGSNTYFPFVTICANGDTYSVTSTGTGTYNLNRWMELR